MTGKKLWPISFFQIGLHMHSVPQNKDKFPINNLFYCCKALLFTQSSVCEFLCGLIFMGHPVFSMQLQKSSMVVCRGIFTYSFKIDMGHYGPCLCDNVMPEPVWNRVKNYNYCVTMNFMSQNLLGNRVILRAEW